jgi:hypothetical protein
MVREIFPPHGPFFCMGLDPTWRDLHDYSMPCGKKLIEKP